MAMHQWRRARKLVIAAAVIFAGSCATPSDDTPDKAEQQVVEPTQQPTHPDPGPTVERGLGEWTAETTDHSVEATAVYSTQSHVYGAADIPDVDVSDVVWWEVAPERRAVIAPVRSDDGGLRIWFRLLGGGMPDEPVTITVVEHLPDIGEDAVFTEVAHEIEIGGFDAAEGDREVTEEFAKAMSSYFRRLRRRAGDGASPFYAFASNRIVAMYDDDAELPEPRPRQRRRQLDRALQFHTGLSAIDQTLQRHRGIRTARIESVDERTIPIDDLEQIEPDGLPFDEMLEQLDDEPSVERLAGFVPDDVLYLHFDDLRVFRRLLRRMEDGLPPLIQATRGAGERSGAGDHYQTQLALETTGLSEQLGHLVADEVAVVTSDPLFGAGSDISMLFEVTDRARLDQAFDHYENKIRERIDVEVVDETIADRPVRLLTSGDGRVRQFRVDLEDDIVVVSNSRRALRRLLEVEAGERRALSDSDDFRYMRAMYPHRSNADEGFVFFGERFVERVVGPEMRIAAARRAHSRADLTAVNYAALLFGWLRGRSAEDVDELIEEGIVNEEELVHPDGSPIEFSPDGGAFSKWGDARLMTPLVDIEVEAVSEAEQQAYDRFRRGYQRQWRQLIDPVGARLTYRDNRLSVDGRMVPLPDRSPYDALSRAVGHQPVEPKGFDTGFRWTLGVADDADLRSHVGMMATQMTGRADLDVDWLGEWVMVGVSDRGSLWDIALQTGVIPSEETHLRTRHGMQSIPRYAQIPLYAGADLRSKVALTTTLTAARSFVEDVAPGQIEWGQFDSYRDVPVVAVRPAEAPDDDPWAEVGIYYAIVDDTFVVSLDLTTLKILVDELLDGESTSGAHPMQSTIEVKPDADRSWLTQVVLGAVESQVYRGRREARSGLEAVIRGVPEFADDPDRWATVSERYLGVVYADPHGGEWAMGAHGQPEHSLAMGDRDTFWPEIPVEGSPVTELLLSLRDLELAIDVYEEDEHRGLRTRFVWEPL